MLARGIVDFAARHLVDEDGRPVAEVGSPLYRDTPTELVACPYADARAGLPMNRTALRQTMAAWPDVLATLASLAGPRPTVHRAWAASVTLLALPLVAPRPVPRLVSVTHKVAQGLSQVLTAMLLAEDGVADAPLGALGDGPAFFAALDAGRWLIGAEQACAGPTARIVEAFDALAGRVAVGPCPPDVAALANAVGEVPIATVGLHVAHLAALQGAARRGEGDPVVTDLPWMRSLFAVPERPPEHARRLFPTGRVPAVVEGYLAGAHEGREALERSFAAALDVLSG